MGDIARSGDDHAIIIKQDAGLSLRVLLADIAEKKLVCRGLNVQIDQLEQVQVPRLKVKRDCIQREIGRLELQAEELRQKVPHSGAGDDAIDAEFEVKD